MMIQSLENNRYDLIQVPNRLNTREKIILVASGLLGSFFAAGGLSMLVQVKKLQLSNPEIVMAALSLSSGIMILCIAAIAYIRLNRL